MAELFYAFTTCCTIGLCLVTLYSLSGIARGHNILNTGNELPDCSRLPFPDSSEVTNNGASERTSTKRGELLLVSTLDGKISALDPTDEGRLVWSHNTAYGKLLSSTLSSVEFSDRGRWVRLIPSLDGGLYKFDGTYVEAIPFTAETMLKSSFKLGDDTVITGGVESRNYGFCIHSGRLRYICSVEECSTIGEPVALAEDILVVRRETRTIRGVEARTGIEKWNFSVGEHHVIFLKGMDGGCESSVVSDHLVNEDNTFASCADADGSCGSYINELDIKVSIPDGFISAYDDSSNIRWSYKFESPVVNMWHLKNGAVSEMDLFNEDIIFGWENSYSPSKSPSVYVGVHEDQPYVKQSAVMQRKIESAFQQHLSSNSILSEVVWKPYIVSAPSRTPVINVGKKDPSHAVQVKEGSTALILRNEFDYPYDNGYYLFDATSHPSSSDNSSHCTSEEEESLDQIIIVSLWHWWKEVLVISVLTSVVVNFIITYPVVKKLKRYMQQSHSSSQAAAKPSSLEADIEPPATENSPEVKSVEFVSRYLTDFEPIQCLGKGGFGVVFESRNKLDDCSYAVKRICLPNRKEAREKVMREVKALAKLDHSGIVRYFNAWLECPPPGWQEEADKQWDVNLRISTTPYSSTTASPCSPIKQKSINPLKPFDGTNGKSPFSTTPSYDADDRSSSCSLDKQQSNVNSCFASSGSFEIVFNSTQEGGGDAWTDQVKVSKNDANSESTSYSPSPVGEIPFKRYQNNIPKTDASECAADDSVCAGYSQSTEEFEMKLESGKSTSEHKKNISANEMVLRPTTLKLDGKKQNTESAKIYLYIQMQLCRKESLKDWLNANNTDRSREEVLDIFDQIVCAVQYVHECGLMHRDLKPSNIFFSLDGTVKIGDFGLVTAMSEKEAHTPAAGQPVQGIKTGSRHTDRVGTQLYMSPEQISGNGYNHKVDIFSLGIIFYELLNPFPTQMERIKILLDVKKQIYPASFQKNHPEECKFITELLSHNPEKRPSASEIRDHPFFKEFQPQPAVIARVRRRRTLSQRMSSSSSDCDSLTADGSGSVPSASR